MPELTRARVQAILAAYEAVADDPDPDAAAVWLSDATRLGLGENGFDWLRWPAYEQRQIEDPDFIAAADLETLRRLATTHVRLERFVSGHLAHMRDIGVLAAITGRLRTLVEQDGL